MLFKYSKFYFPFILLFATTTIFAQQNPINFSIDTITLEGITIAASKFEDNKLQVPNQIQTISKNEIALQNTQTAADLLANSGAAFVQKSQGGGGSPIIRGFEANKVLIVVDDVRMNNAIFRGGHLQNILRIDNNMLERAEVVYGTGSLVYGSDALGGVMHFRTLQAALSKTDKTQISSASMLRYGSVNNEMTAHARVNIGGKKWASLTGISFSKFGNSKQGGNNNPFCDTCALVWQRPVYVQTNNGIDTVISNNNPLLQVPTAYNQLNLSQQFRYQNNTHITHSLLFKYSNTTNVPRYDRLSEMSGGLPRFAEWYYGPETWFSASYQLKTSQKSNLYDEASLTAAYQLFKESRHSRRLNKALLKNQYETLHAATLNADAIKKIGKQRLQYGIELVHNTVGSIANFKDVTNINAALEAADTRYPDGGSSVWSASLYAANRWSLSNNWDINAGLRFNYSTLKATFNDTTFFKFPFSTAEQSNNALVGNIGIVYHTNNGFKVGTTISTGYRTPNIDDMTKVFESVVGSDAELGILIVPNPDLQPEKTTNFDISIEKRINEKGNIFLNTFYTIYNNALVNAPFTLNGESTILYEGYLANIYATQNRDKAQIMGISGGATLPLGKYFTLSGQASYTIGNILTDSTSTPLDHIAPMYGKLGFAYKNSRLNTDLYALFNGAKPLDRYRIDGEDNLQYATPNGLPAWFTLNLKASYQLNQYLEIQTGIENILDTNYRVFASGISAGGRNFLVALRTKF